MDKLEQIARELHEAWRDYQTAQGRVLGAERTVYTHPHMLPWEELDCSSQNQDRYIAAVVIEAWIGGSLTSAHLPSAIHEAWRRWVALHGRSHDHARPYESVHSVDASEHALQAERVEALLPKPIEPR